MEYKDRNEWLANNPLRLWLNENNETVTGLASQICRNPSTVHLWLRGAIIPTESFWKLEIVMKEDDVEETWLEWYKSQPGVIPDKQAVVNE